MGETAKQKPWHAGLGPQYQHTHIGPLGHGKATPSPTCIWVLSSGCWHGLEAGAPAVSTPSAQILASHHHTPLEEPELQGSCRVGRESAHGNKECYRQGTRQRIQTPATRNSHQASLEIMSADQSPPNTTGHCSE